MRFGSGCARSLFALLALVLMAPTVFGAMCQIQDAVTVGNRVWMLCGRERLFYTDDQGTNWRPVELPPDILYRSLVFLDERRALIAGNEGTILASEDGGKSWSKRQAPTKENLNDIAFVKESVWIVGQNGVVLHSADAGRTWERQETKVPQGLAAVSFLDEQNGWVAGWMGVVLRTRDGGKTWEPVKIADASWSLSYIHFRDSRTGWIAGMFGQLLQTTDGGETWTLRDIPVKGTISFLYTASDGRVYAATGNDILVSKDGGAKWEPSGINQWLFFTRIVRAGNSLWAVGTFQILRWDSAKSQWVRMENTPGSQT